MLEKSDFEKNSKLTFDLSNSQGEEVQVWLPQPSVERTDTCLPIFESLYIEFKRLGGVNNEVIFGKFDTLMRNLELQNPSIRSDFEAWVEHLILGGKFVVLRGEFKGQVGELSDFLNDEPKVRRYFGILSAFWYALLQFIGAIGLSKESELRAFYTALSFEDFKEASLKFIEEMEKQSSKQGSPII